MKIPFFNVETFLQGTAPQGEIPSHKELILESIRIAWPSIVETFLIALIGMVDSIMVSSLGSYAIAAVGLTTQPKFICLAFFISLNAAVSALVARRHGQKNREAANKVLTQTLVITAVMTVVISILGVLLASPIIKLSGSASDTHEAAVSYFKIIIGGIGFSTISMVINAAQRGAGNTKISMRTNLISNLVNIVMNFLLINGYLGFPRLGLKGAAIATVLGSIVGFVMSIISVLSRNNFISLISYWKITFDRVTMKAVIAIGSSTLAEQVFLRIGFLIYSVIVAKLGTTVFAAHQIGMNLMSISFSFGDGLSIAAIALVGHNLGAGRPDLAKIYGNICQRIGFIFASILSVIYLSMGRNFFTLFSNEEEILSMGDVIMKLLVVIVFFQITQVVYSGCLRGAGDAKFTALVSLISVAIIRPGAGFLFTYTFGLGITGAWLGLALDQICRLILTMVRFKGGKWVHLKI